MNEPELTPWDWWMIERAVLLALVATYNGLCDTDPIETSHHLTALLVKIDPHLSSTPRPRELPLDTGPTTTAD